MGDLLERLRRDDPSALEELGHELLPFVQAAVIAQTFEARDPAAVLQVFRDEVTLASRSADAATFSSVVVAQVRARTQSIPTVAPDISQAEALTRLKRMEPLPVADREVVIARFVERLPAEMCCKFFGLDAAGLAAVLARGATLLVGPAPAGSDWATAPSLTNPDAEPVPQFVELENALTCLAIDVTALERQPLMTPAAMPVPVPVPVLKPGFVPQVPQEHYPSKVVTQGFVDLPANVSSFAPVPSAPRPPRPSRPSVVVSPELQTSPTPLWAAGPVERDDVTETQGVPIVLPPTESTEPRGKPLIAVSAADSTDPQAKPVEETVTGGKALPLPVEETVTGGKALAPKVEETVTGGKALKGHPMKAVDDGMGYFAEPDAAEHTEIGASLVMPQLPVAFYQRLPAQWWFGGAAFCAVLGVSLYWGMVTYVAAKVQRPWTMVSVVAAARDLPEGTKITLELLALRSVPKDHVTVSVVRPESIEYALGQKLEFPLQAGDPLLWSQFDPATRNKRFDVMKRGRAYAIPVTELKGLGGMLLPKEEVDLVMTVNPPTGTDPKAPIRTRAITLLQKVRILAVGPVTTLNIGRVQRRYTDLTLMLVPEEVEVLSLAQRTGEITATLRNTEDNDVIARGETTIQTLLSGVRLKAIERKRGAVIDVIRAQPAR